MTLDKEGPGSDTHRDCNLGSGRRCCRPAIHWCATDNRKCSCCGGRWSGNNDGVPPRYAASRDAVIVLFTTVFSPARSRRWLALDHFEYCQLSLSATPHAVLDLGGAVSTARPAMPVSGSEAVPRGPQRYWSCHTRASHAGCHRQSRALNSIVENAAVFKCLFNIRRLQALARQA